jgi:Zn-dependent protease with chaperone function
MPEGTYYDGRSARRHAVQVMFANGCWIVRGEGVERREAAGAVRLSERLGSVPRSLQFSDGAYCELPEQPGLAQVLARAGATRGLVERLQNSRRAAIAATAGIVVVVAAAYVWGLPLAVDVGARMVPQRIVEQASASTLKLLDARMLEPSALPAEQRAAIADGFGKLRGSAEARLLFRSGGVLGPNALALPDGTVLLFDELVVLAGNDEEIVAVLSHELGHVHHRHGFKLLIRSTLLGAASAWWLGDFSALLAIAPAVLMQARYSRELESEADAWARTLLDDAGIPVVRLADMLERLQWAAPGADSASDAPGWSRYLDSHPAWAQRIARLRTPIEAD